MCLAKAPIRLKGIRNVRSKRKLHNGSLFNNSPGIRGDCNEGITMGRKTSAILLPNNTRDYDKECLKLFEELQQKEAIKKGIKNGIVQAFSVKRGTGYIKPDDGGNNIFVHYNDITGKGFKVLRPGQQVRYYLGERNKRKYAKGVTVVM
jgi:cold shock protein